jgi:signal transduction histidine kinase
VLAAGCQDVVQVEKVNESTPAPTEPQTRSLLEFLQTQLEVHAANKPAPAANILEGLVRVFDADGAGVAAPLEGAALVQHRWPTAAATSPRFPWEEQPQTLTPLRVRPTVAVRCSGSGKSFLLAAMPGSAGRSQLLWVERSGNRDWSAASDANLVIAARVLAPLFLETKSGDGVFPALDQVRLQERLQDAGTISARVAHAFDNILTGILGFAELTLSQTESQSPNRAFLEEVVKAAQQGVSLTQQLHFFSRCAVPTVGPATLAYVFGEEQARLRSLLPPTISLKVEVPPELPSVAMDAELLRQVVGHLLDNAREAITSGGTLTLSARRMTLEADGASDLLGQPMPGPCVEVVITGNGPEISADVRRRLFQEPFFSTKPRHRGLGLAIVYRVLQAHRGSFRLVTGPSATTVHLYLPLAPG